MKLKRGLLYTAASIVALSASGVSQAAIVFNDNFDAYNAGPLVGQGGWVQLGASVINPVQVSAAKDVPLADNGQDVQEAFAAAVLHDDGTTITTDLDVNITTPKAGVGDFFAHLTASAAGSPFYNRFYVKAGATAGTMAIGLAAGTPVSSAVDIHYGADIPIGAYQLTSTWNFVPGAANDEFSMNLDGAPYVPLFTWGATTAEPADVALFNLRQGSASTAPVIAGVDNLVVDAVVPEPGAVSLLLGAGALLMGRRSRKP